MPSTKGAAPTSFEEGMHGVIQAISACMTAPDAGPKLPLLQELLKASVGAIQKQPAGGAPGGPPGAGAPPGAPPGGPPQGGGMNLNQLQGQPPSGPSAGLGGGPSGSGISSDDLRRAMAAQASTAG